MYREYIGIYVEVDTKRLLEIAVEKEKAGANDWLLYTCQEKFKGQKCSRILSKNN